MSREIKNIEISRTRCDIFDEHALMQDRPLSIKLFTRLLCGKKKPSYKSVMTASIRHGILEHIKGIKERPSRENVL